MCGNAASYLAFISSMFGYRDFSTFPLNLSSHFTPKRYCLMLAASSAKNHGYSDHQPIKKIMNYEEYLKQHEALQKQQEVAAQEKATRRRIALEESLREADELIHGVIKPELESLLSALQGHGFQARISEERDVSELQADSAFAMAIQLRDGASNDLPKRGLVFRAIPNDKSFTTELHTSLDRSARPSCGEIKYSCMTQESVQHLCYQFLRLAFPVA